MSGFLDAAIVWRLTKFRRQYISGSATRSDLRTDFNKPAVRYRDRQNTALQSCSISATANRRLYESFNASTTLWWLETFFCRIDSLPSSAGATATPHLRSSPQQDCDIHPQHRDEAGKCSYFRRNLSFTTCSNEIWHIFLVPMPKNIMRAFWIV